MLEIFFFLQLKCSKINPSNSQRTPQMGWGQGFQAKAPLIWRVSERRFDSPAHAPVYENPRPVGGSAQNGW